MAVGFDATGSGFLGGGQVLTWTHVVGGTATDLVVGLANIDTTAMSSVKCGTTAMTLLGSVINNNTTGDGRTAAWGLTNPPTGSQTITASAANTFGNIISVSMSFTGSNGYGTVSTGFGAGTSGSTTVSSTTSGNMVVGVLSCGSAIISSGNTDRILNNVDVNTGYDNIDGATANSTGSAVTMSWSLNSDNWGCVAFEVKAAGAAAAFYPYKQYNLAPLRRAANW